MLQPVSITAQNQQPGRHAGMCPATVSVVTVVIVTEVVNVIIIVKVVIVVVATVIIWLRACSTVAQAGCSTASHTFLGFANSVKCLISATCLISALHVASAYACVVLVGGLKRVPNEVYRMSWQCTQAMLIHHGGQCQATQKSGCCCRSRLLSGALLAPLQPPLHVIRWHCNVNTVAPLRQTPPVAGSSPSLYQLLKPWCHLVKLGPSRLK